MEAKVIDVSELLEGVFWQWQAGPNPDPWAEKDPAKRTWQDYSDDDCRIIEEAFMLKKEIADLKDYEVDLKKMVQVNKRLRDRVRRVRRQEKSRFMMKMSEPVALAEDQKTMNQAFGTIQHFLEYIMKRTPEAYGLYQRLKTLKLDSKNHEFQDIMREVIICIGKGAETREKIIKTRSASQTTNFLAEAKSIADMIKMNSTTLGDFLKTILRAYTMETFICYWLNELLRSENWEEINVLTPYLVCLVYIFKLSEYIIKYQGPQGIMKNLLGYVMKPKLYLYRGAALAKEHLELYDSKKIKYFSWNGVTSTSREKNVALNFIQLSLEKAKKLNEPKVGVFFLIETDFASAQDCEGMIDIFQNSCSEYPDEQEVILAPGTVFELLKTRLIEKDIYEVSLRVKRKFEETKENIALLGTLQDQTILKDKAIIDGLPSQQSFRVLEMLKGNKLIRKLEIRNSGIEEHIMEEINNLRLTTNVKREDVKFRDNTVVLSSLGLLAYYLSAEKLDEIFTFNKIRFKDGEALENKNLEIKKLVLGEEALERFQRNNQLKGFYKKLKDATEIEHLDLSIRKTEETDDKLIDFLGYIRELKRLQNLRIKINEKQAISKDDFEIICQTIEGSKTLNQFHLELTLSNEALISLEKTLVSIVSVQNLSLDFKFVRQISNEGLNYLRNGLIQLKSLQHLSLDFKKCKELLAGGLVHLKNSLKSLTSLRHLSLDFHECSLLTKDQELIHLKDGLTSLTSLRHLSLDFCGCHFVKEEGLNYLKDGLVSLTSLQHLSLNFHRCPWISDEMLKHFKSVFISLNTLQHLSLNFAQNSTISDQGLNHLKDALIFLTFLQHLSLDFYYCYQISDEGLKYLKSALLPLTLLQSLTLGFKNCKEISDKGLSNLESGLRSKTSLQRLSFDFEWCSKISSSGVYYITYPFKSLTSLQHLSLDFNYCREISDEGLLNLGNALLSMTCLNHLCLGFRRCEEISSKGLNHLSRALISLTSLQHLSLDFRMCKKISDEGFLDLESALRSMTSLHHLHLDFANCSQISNRGLNYLGSALLSLGSFTSFQHLYLEFQGCKISNKGLSNFKSALGSLSSLQHLSLVLGTCKEISDEGLTHVKDALISLTCLQHLDLLFDRNKISDQGLDQLQSGLISLTSLQDLFLGFRECQEISDRGLSHLKSGLISLKCLHTLMIAFRSCIKISDEGLNHLQSGIIFLKSLKVLYLEFKDCKKITYRGKSRFCDELKWIPELTLED